MSKRTYIAFGLLIVVLAVAIPWLVFESKGEADRGESAQAGRLDEGKTLFQINCGNCHALYAAGADGNYGPDLDELLAPGGVPSGEGAEEEIEQIEARVLSAIENGVNNATTPTRMPPGILDEEQAKEVAAFVAHTAGEG